MADRAGLEFVTDPAAAARGLVSLSLWERVGVRAKCHAASALTRPLPDGEEFLRVGLASHPARAHSLHENTAPYVAIALGGVSNA